MVHRRLVYIYLLNVPSFSSCYFNKIKRTSRLGRLLALSLEILTESHNGINNQQRINNNRTIALERTAAKATAWLKCIFLVPNLRPRFAFVEAQKC